ncbi:MAG: transposase [Candidatus Competibacteraceae bacterium]|nr:transposase [Candidatus Competibacteraceae bacterium]
MMVNFLLWPSSKNDGQNALEYYKERWQIETLFSCLKSRGFNSKRSRY